MTMSSLIGKPAIGIQFSTQPDYTTPSAPGNADAEAFAWSVISNLAQRLQNVESQIKFTVQGNAVISAITLSPEEVLIQSDQIGILGETTFADYIRNINGQIVGGIDPSITRIRGGVIQTEQILSEDSNSYIDLDNTGANPFIYLNGGSAVLNADGTFTFGESSGGQLIWNGTTLSITSNATIAGTAASSVVSNANNVPNKLNKNIADSLSAGISLTTGGAIVVGTAALSASGIGNLTGTGLVLSSIGLGAVSSGTGTFYVDGTNGQFQFGSTSGGNISWNGSTLAITSNAVIAGTAAGTVVTQAATGSTYGTAAYSGLANKLNKNAADSLSGNISLTTGGAIVVGTAALSSSSITGLSGTGLILSPNGLGGVNGGVGTFFISGTTGAATFAGDVSTSGHGYFYGGGTTTGTYTASLVGLSTTTGADGVTGVSSGSGQHGGSFYTSTAQPALYASAGTGPAASFQSTSGAVTIGGGFAINGSGAIQTLGTITALSGYGLAGDTLTLNNATVGTGSATATFNSTNMPGSSGTNTWLTLSINGTNRRFPVW